VSTDPGAPELLTVMVLVAGLPPAATEGSGASSEALMVAMGPEDDVVQMSAPPKSGRRRRLLAARTGRRGAPYPPAYGHGHRIRSDDSLPEGPQRLEPALLTDRGRDGSCRTESNEKRLEMEWQSAVTVSQS